MSDERADKGIADAFRNLESRGESRGWTAEEVFEAVSGDLPQERVKQLVDMSVDDAELADAFRVARAVRVAGEESEQDGEQVVSTDGRLGRWRNIIAVTAAAAALAAVVWMFPRNGVVEQNTSEIRSAEAYEIEAESEKELSRDEFKLTWTTGPPNTRYFCQVMNHDLEVLFTKKQLETNTVTIPRDDLTTVESGAQVIWRVEAYLEEGQTVRSSAFRTTVTD